MGEFRNTTSLMAPSTVNAHFENPAGYCPVNCGAIACGVYVCDLLDLVSALTDGSSGITYPSPGHRLPTIGFSLCLCTIGNGSVGGFRGHLTYFGIELSMVFPDSGFPRIPAWCPLILMWTIKNLAQERERGKPSLKIFSIFLPISS